MQQLMPHASCFLCCRGEHEWLVPASIFQVQNNRIASSEVNTAACTGLETISRNHLPLGAVRPRFGAAVPIIYILGSAYKPHDA
jgi:hypothetical protein